MNISVDDIVARYNAEIANLTQRAILAEARADALARENEKLNESNASADSSQ